MKKFASILMIVAVAAVANAGTIADAQAAGDGAFVNIDRAVILKTEDTTYSSSSASMQIRDETGAIWLYGSQSAMQTFIAANPVGTHLSFTGVEVDVYNGLIEIKASDWVTGFQGDTAPASSTPAISTAPYARTLPLSNPSDQSELITLTGMTFDDAGDTFQGGNNYTVRDAFNNTIDVRISGDQSTPAALEGQTIPAGQWDLTGVVSYYNGFQLMNPTITPEPASLLLVALGALIRRR